MPVVLILRRLGMKSVNRRNAPLGTCDPPYVEFITRATPYESFHNLDFGRLGATDVHATRIDVLQSRWKLGTLI